MAAEKLEVLLEVDSNSGIAEIKRTSKALDTIGTTSETTGRRAGRALDSMGMKILNVNQLLDLTERAFRLLTLPIEKIVGVGAKFETLELQLSTILQSAEKGKEYFEWIRDFSATTPFRIEGLAESVAMLESFGINSKTHLRTFGDAASALQIPLNELSRVMGQIWSKPNAQMEEMLQLIERGVPVAKILQEQLGLTAEQIASIGNQGIKGKEVFEALAKGMKELYGGAMEKFSGTWTGMISTLQDKVDLFLGQIAGPVLENLKTRLTKLLENIDKWAADGTLEQWGQTLANVFTGLFDIIGGFVDILVGAGKAIATIISYAGGLKTVAATLAIIFAVSKIKAFTAAMDVSSLTFAGLNANITGSNALLMTHIGLTKAANAAWGLFKKALPLLALAAAVKVFVEINEKLSALRKQHDAVMAAEIRHNDVMQQNTEKFRSFRDSVGLSSETLQKMSKDFGHIQDRGIRYNKVMRAIRDGKYGEKLAGQYQTWREEQKKLIDSTGKVENTVTETDKAVQKYRESLKLLSFSEIEKEASLLISALRGKEDQLFKNADALEIVGKKVDEVIKQYQSLGKEPPKVLIDLSAKIKLASSDLDLFKEVGKNTEKVFKEVAGALDTGVVAAEGFQDSTDLTRQSIDAASDMTMNWIEYLEYLYGAALEGVGVFSQFISVLGQFGVISEGAVGAINSAISGITGGLDSILGGIGAITKEGASFFDILLGGLSTISGIGTIATTVIGGIISLLGGKSGEMEAAERRLAGITGLSGDWAEQIEKIAQELGGAESAGRAFNSVLPEIIQNADRTAANFSTLITKTREIVSVFERGNASARETAANYGSAFSEMINFAQELGMEGGEAITGLILLADEFGLKVKEIEEYVQTNMKNAFEGYKNYIEGEFSSVTIGVFEEMRILQDKIADNQKLVDGVRGLSDTMIGLSNATRLTEEQYQNFETSALDAYNALINQGFSSKEALQIMQPMLERLAFLQQQFGYSIDDSTSALIDQGVEAGLISEDMKSENQLMLDGFDRIVDRLDLIAIGLGVKIPEALGSMETASTHALDSIMGETSKWGGSLQNIVGDINEVGGALRSLDKLNAQVISGNTIITEWEKWRKVIAATDTQINKMPDSIRALDSQFYDSSLILDQIFAGYQQQTQKWQDALKEVESEMAAATKDAMPELEAKYNEIIQGMETDTGLFKDYLLDIADKFGLEIPAELTSLEAIYSAVMSQMSTDTAKYKMSAEGVILTLDQLIRKQSVALAGSKGFGSGYGVYTEEEKAEKTSEFLAMTKQWEGNRDIILGDIDFFKNFAARIKGFKGAITDEYAQKYETWVSWMDPVMKKLQDGYTWNEEDRKWIPPEPDVKAAEGFRTVLDRPTSIFLRGKHILAGEAGPEIFSITPLQGVPMPVSRRVSSDLPPMPYVPASKTGSDSKSTKKEVTVTVKIEGKIEGAYPPVIIQTKQDGSVNKEKLRASIGEIVDDNHRGFVDRIAQKVVEKIKEEL